MTRNLLSDFRELAARRPEMDPLSEELGPLKILLIGIDPAGEVVISLEDKYERLINIRSGQDRRPQMHGGLASGLMFKEAIANEIMSYELIKGKKDINFSQFGVLTYDEAKELVENLQRIKNEKSPNDRHDLIHWAKEEGLVAQDIEG